MRCGRYLHAPAMTWDEAHRLPAWLLGGGGSNCGDQGARFGSPYIESLSC